MEIFPNWTVIPVVTIFLTLVFFLNRLFFTPLRKVLEERHARIEGAREEAENIRKTSQERIAEFDQKMREARRESDLHMAQVKNRALEEKNRLLSEKKAEVEKMLKEARIEIREKTDQAAKQLEQQAGIFARQIASHILKRPVQTK